MALPSNLKSLYAAAVDLKLEELCAEIAGVRRPTVISAQSSVQTAAVMTRYSSSHTLPRLSIDIPQEKELIAKYYGMSSKLYGLKVHRPENLAITVTET